MTLCSVSMERSFEEPGNGDGQTWPLPPTSRSVLRNYLAALTLPFLTCKSKIVLNSKVVMRIKLNDIAYQEHLVDMVIIFDKSCKLSISSFWTLP